jgi:hypothetical protein
MTRRSAYAEVHGTLDEALRGYMKPTRELASARLLRLQSPDVTRRDASDTVPTHGNGGGAAIDARSASVGATRRHSRPTVGRLDA